MRSSKTPGKDNIEIDGIVYGKGNRVRLVPAQKKADAIDLLLVGKIATIEKIFIDYENRVHLAVTINEDPGQDMQRNLGRYLYFSPEEVELIE